MAKKAVEQVKNPAAVSAGRASSPPARRIVRRVLPPSDPVLVREINDSESEVAADAPTPAQPTQSESRPRREGEASYSKKGHASAPPASSKEAEAVDEQASAVLDPTPEVPTRSPKRSTPDTERDDNKSGEPKKRAKEFPAYLLPSYLSDEHAVDAASVNASWDPKAWGKLCRKGAAYKAGSEASSNNR